MFETERLLIRPVIQADDKRLVQALNQPDFLRTSTKLPLVPVSEDLIKEITKGRAKHELPHYAICHKPLSGDSSLKDGIADEDAKPPRMIGTLSFKDDGFDYKNRACEIGIGFFDARDRGKGFGTEVLKWALDYGFYELGMHRIGLVCYSMNEAGIALYRKIGFIEEGRLRQTCYSRGKWYDSLIFGMLEEDWVAARKD